jgi:hypothetical protein
MIKSQPSAAEVLISGKAVGKTPVELLIEKETEIALSKEGFITQKTILTGKNSSIDISLKEVPVEPQPSTNQMAVVTESEVVENVVAPPTITAQEKPSSNSKYLFAILGAAAIAIVFVFLVFRKK